MTGVAKTCNVSIRAEAPSCNGNIRRSLQMAMRLDPDFIIHIEDDVLLGGDALPWMLHCATQLTPEDFTVGCWEHPSMWEKPITSDWGRFVQATRCDWFCAWGWGAKPSVVDEMLAAWPEDNTESWDIVVRDKVRKGRPSIHPLVGRAINIGEKSGTHRGDNLGHSFINGRISREDVQRMEAQVAS